MAPLRLCGRRTDARVVALSLAAVLVAVVLVVTLAGGDEADDGALVMPDASAPASPAVNAPGNTPAPPGATCRDDSSWVDIDGDGCSTCKFSTVMEYPLICAKLSPRVVYALQTPGTTGAATGIRLAAICSSPSMESTLTKRAAPVVQNALRSGWT